MTASQESNDSGEKPARVPLANLPRLFVSRRWWWTTLLVLVGISVTMRLGFWQLDRLQQKRARNTEFIEQVTAPPLVLEGSPLPGETSDLRDLPAEAEGRFDYSNQLVLMQQNYEGRPGAHLVTPFVIEGGNRAVLVDRGWIPAHELDTDDLGRFNVPGQETVSGYMQPSQTLSRARATPVDGTQEAWYRIDIEAIQEQMPYELLPVYLLEEPAADIQEQLPFRVEPEIDLTEGPHLGYAIQWFLFTIMLAVGYARFVSVRGAKRDPSES